MLSSSVFRKVPPRRPFTPSFEGSLFSFIANVLIEDPDRVGTGSESPSPVPTVAQILPSRHIPARDEKQPLVSSSKMRSYKSPSNCDGRKSFGIRSYKNCRVSPTIFPSFFFHRSLHDRHQPFVAPFFSYSYELPNFQVLCFEILTTVPGVGGGCCASSKLGHSDLQTFRQIPQSIPFVFKRFRTLLHSPKTQLFCFQSLPHSLPKTSGVGVRRITISSSHLQNVGTASQGGEDDDGGSDGSGVAGSVGRR